MKEILTKVLHGFVMVAELYSIDNLDFLIVTNSGSVQNVVIEMELQRMIFWRRTMIQSAPSVVLT